MSKKLIAIIVAVILVAGVAGFILLKGDDEDTKSNSSVTSSSENAKKDTSTTSGNVFSLSEAGKAQRCAFTYSGSNGTGDGTMYSDGKGRGLMTLNVTSEQGNSMVSNTLVLSDKVYSWTATNGQTIGFVANKSTYTSNQSSNTQTSSSATQNTDASQSYKVKCVAWEVDESTLAVPSSVSFQTLPGQQ